MISKLLKLTVVGSAAALAIAYAAPAAAYVAPTQPNTCQASVTTVAGGQPFDLTCLFAPDSAVTFFLKSGPPGCTATFNPPSGRTDQQGVINTIVTLQANCPGTYVLGALSGGVEADVTVTEVAGYPNTGALRPESPVLPAFGIIGGGVALLIVSGGVLLRRRS